MTNEPGGLGAIVHFDDRSRAFQIATLLDAQGIVKPRSYTWSCAPRLNQSAAGTCVGHAVAHEIAARPVVRPASHDLAIELYDEAQQNDPWTETPPIEGTGLIDGVKAATRRGFYSEYRWAGAGSGHALEDLILAVGYKGPALVATNWHTGMDSPASPSYRVHAQGAVRGRHAVLYNGVSIKWLGRQHLTVADIDLTRTLFRIHNSWGDWWADHGECFISAADVELLLQEQGEACIPTVRL